MDITQLLTILTMLLSLAGSPDLDSAQRQQALDMANNVRAYVLQYAVSMQEQEKTNKDDVDEKPENASEQNETGSSSDVDTEEENVAPEPETTVSEPVEPLSNLQKKQYQKRERATMTPSFAKP